VLTQDVPNDIPFAVEILALQEETIVSADCSAFGANHNAVFVHCDTALFRVCNPDIRLLADPFPVLLQAFENPCVAVVAPLVRNPAGSIEVPRSRTVPSAASTTSMFLT